jgi:hypothetical protein
MRRHGLSAITVTIGAMVILLVQSSSISAQTVSWLVPWPGLDVYGIAADGKDGAYAAGTFDVEGESFVRRVNAAGHAIWTHHFRPDPDPIFHQSSVSVFDAAATGDGVVVVGYVTGILPGEQSAGDYDAWIRKYDAAGQILWTRQFGTNGIDLANDVAVAADGNIYVSGYLGFLALPPSGWPDAFVRKYDASGNEVWTQQLGDQNTVDAAWALTVAPDETIYVVSESSSGVVHRTFLWAFDRFGNQILMREVDQFGLRAAASDDSVFVVGQESLRRYDRSGTELWTLSPGLYRPFGGIDVDSSGNAYIAGFSDRLSVVSYDPSGIERWRFDFSQAGGEYVRQVDVGPAGDVFISGAGFIAKIGFGSSELSVSIDIRPGGAVNPINLSAKGIVPVAILTTSSFDATTVVAETVCFGDQEDAAARNCTEADGRGHVEDVDRDGDLDLIVHFEIAGTGIDRGDTNACLTGTTTDGIAVTGCDAIVVR